MCSRFMSMTYWPPASDRMYHMTWRSASVLSFQTSRYGVVSLKRLTYEEFLSLCFSDKNMIWKAAKLANGNLRHNSIVSRQNSNACANSTQWSDVPACMSVTDIVFMMKSIKFTEIHILLSASPMYLSSKRFTVTYLLTYKQECNS